MIKVFFLISLLLLLPGCNNNKENNQTGVNENTSTNQFETEGTDTAKEVKDPNLNIVYLDDFKWDTIVDNYQISCLIKDTEDLIPTNDDSMFFAAREATLDIRFKDKQLSPIIISRSTLLRYLKVEENKMEQYDLCKIHFEGIENGKVVLRCNCCINDTDMCVYFRLYINEKGKLEIRDVTEEMFDDDPE